MDKGKGWSLAHTQFLSGLQEGETQRRVIRKLHDRERPADPVITVIHAVYLLIILAPYKIWKNVAIGPSDVAELGPVFVILARASHIRHPVHDARTTENLRGFTFYVIYGFADKYLRQRKILN